jgi:hypothetical protein
MIWLRIVIDHCLCPYIRSRHVGKAFPKADETRIEMGGGRGSRCCARVMLSSSGEGEGLWP